MSAILFIAGSASNKVLCEDIAFELIPSGQNHKENVNSAIAKAFKMFWILLPAILFLLAFLVTYLIGSFIPHTTNMCVVDVERNIGQCFALANQLELYPKYIKTITDLKCEENDFSSVGSKGSLIAKSAQYPFEVVEFIPNYRFAVQHKGELDKWLLQLSFYKLSLNNTRLVLIARVESDSRFRRAAHAWSKKRLEKYFNRQLAQAKICVENEPDVVETYSDVSPELNPNFSLN